MKDQNAPSVIVIGRASRLTKGNGNSNLDGFDGQPFGLTRD